MAGRGVLGAGYGFGIYVPVMGGAGEEGEEAGCWASEGKHFGGVNGLRYLRDVVELV